jgi:hypothetical protein
MPSNRRPLEEEEEEEVCFPSVVQDSMLCMVHVHSTVLMFRKTGVVNILPTSHDRV